MRVRHSTPPVASIDVDDAAPPIVKTITLSTELFESLLCVVTRRTLCSSSSNERRWRRRAFGIGSRTHPPVIVRQIGAILVKRISETFANNKNATVIFDGVGGCSGGNGTSLPSTTTTTFINGTSDVVASIDHNIRNGFNNSRPHIGRFEASITQRIA